MKPALRARSGFQSTSSNATDRSAVASIASTVAMTIGSSRVTLK